nr:hypothetical protein 440p1_00022 [Serratia entomophila]ULG11663.1 hypothetical protein 440p1_00047 [Serratia entomophila]ULG11695.1 hypothetical protein 442p_00005 [Serratia entomophila]
MAEGFACLRLETSQSRWGVWDKVRYANGLAGGASAVLQSI